MIIQWFIVITFWLSYSIITFASVLTISDFIQAQITRRKAKTNVKKEGT